MPHLFTIIFGPTASGKTKLAAQLAREHSADILSYDSRHVFLDMDVVTGKDLAELGKLQTFGFNLITPDQEFSIRHFVEYAKPIIEQHRQEKKPLILVGGSWQYVEALLAPPASLDVAPNAALRKRFENLPLEQLQTEIEKQYPQTWSTLNGSDKANSRRLLRLLESGETREKNTASTLKPILSTEECRFIFLEKPIAELETKIQSRIVERWNHGALEETRHLTEKYPDWDTPAFTATGYHWIREFLDGRMSAEETRERWFRQERQYAKRQLTWLKKVKLRYER